MDCGIPFCQSSTGCPIDNLIPEWNELVYQGEWKAAWERLVATNNFPEFTGRICPAPCESACVLGIIEPAVSIKSIECAIADRAFAEGWVQPRVPGTRTGRRVAVVGSGPAGLAAADQLNQAGHQVTVFERDDRAGGLLTYGVPNMKLDKSVVERRVRLLQAEGVEIRTGIDVGGRRPGSLSPAQLRQDYDAMLLACGALEARDLDLPGRSLKGVCQAMDYLSASTRTLLDGMPSGESVPNARGRNVVVIGGGDTGTDCIATALRQGCQSLVNITRREREPDQRDAVHPWPGLPGTFLVDYGHAEAAAAFGGDPRAYKLLPVAFIDDGRGRVCALRVRRLEWNRDDDGRTRAREVPGSDTDLPAELVLLSVGFTGHDSPGLLAGLGLKDEGGRLGANPDTLDGGIEGVFVAGDMRRGASLIVWAIAEGRRAARRIDQYLMGDSDLPDVDGL